MDVAGNDEFARLAGSFNRMSEEIEKRNAEIHGWNQELQERVDDRTTELREAQKQLLHSQKLSAVNSLAAGVAHEINNPLFSILTATILVQFLHFLEAFGAGLPDLTLSLITSAPSRQRPDSFPEPMRPCLM